MGMNQRLLLCALLGVMVVAMAADESLIHELQGVPLTYTVPAKGFSVKFDVDQSATLSIGSYDIVVRGDKLEVQQFGMTKKTATLTDATGSTHSMWATVVDAELAIGQGTKLYANHLVAMLMGSTLAQEQVDVFSFEPGSRVSNIVVDSAHSNVREFVAPRFSGEYEQFNQPQFLPTVSSYGFELTFNVMATDAASLAFLPKRTGTAKDAYEIVLGATSSVHHGTRGGALVSQETPTVKFTPDHYVPFWVQLVGGRLTVGTGRTVGADGTMFLSTNVPNLVTDSLTLGFAGSAAHPAAFRIVKIANTGAAVAAKLAKATEAAAKKEAAAVASAAQLALVTKREADKSSSGEGKRQQTSVAALPPGIKKTPAIIKAEEVAATAKVAARSAIKLAAQQAAAAALAAAQTPEAKAAVHAAATARVAKGAHKKAQRKLKDLLAILQRMPTNPDAQRAVADAEARVARLADAWATAAVEAEDTAQTAQGVQTAFVKRGAAERALNVQLAQATSSAAQAKAAAARASLVVQARAIAVGKKKLAAKKAKLAAKARQLARQQETARIAQAKLTARLLKEKAAEASGVSKKKAAKEAAKKAAQGSASAKGDKSSTAAAKDGQRVSAAASKGGKASTAAAKSTKRAATAVGAKPLTKAQRAARAVVHATKLEAARAADAQFRDALNAAKKLEASVARKAAQRERAAHKAARREAALAKAAKAAKKQVTANTVGSVTQQARLQVDTAAQVLKETKESARTTLAKSSSLFTEVTGYVAKLQGWVDAAKTSADAAPIAASLATGKVLRREARDLRNGAKASVAALRKAVVALTFVADKLVADDRRVVKWTALGKAKAVVGPITQVQLGKAVPSKAVAAATKAAKQAAKQVTVACRGNAQVDAAAAKAIAAVAKAKAALAKAQDRNSLVQSYATPAAYKMALKARVSLVRDKLEAKRAKLAQDKATLHAEAAKEGPWDPNEEEELKEAIENADGNVDKFEAKLKAIKKRAKILSKLSLPVVKARAAAKVAAASQKLAAAIKAATAATKQQSSRRAECSTARATAHALEVKATTLVVKRKLQVAATNFNALLAAQFKAGLATQKALREEKFSGIQRKKQAEARATSAVEAARPSVVAALAAQARLTKLSAQPAVLKSVRAAVAQAARAVETAKRVAARAATEAEVVAALAPRVAAFWAGVTKASWAQRLM